MSELTRAAKQNIIDSHEGVLDVAPFEVEVSDDLEDWTKATLVGIDRDSKYPYRVLMCCSFTGLSYGLYLYCRLPEEEEHVEEPTIKAGEVQLVYRVSVATVGNSDKLIGYFTDHHEGERVASSKEDGVCKVRGFHVVKFNDGRLFTIGNKEIHLYKEPKTRFMTAREISKLARDGAEFVRSSRLSMYSPTILNDNGVVMVVTVGDTGTSTHIVPLEWFMGYRLEEGGEILPFTVEE
jgi:hypothetical protein